MESLWWITEKPEQTMDRVNCHHNYPNPALSPVSQQTGLVHSCRGPTRHAPTTEDQLAADWGQRAEDRLLMMEDPSVGPARPPWIPNSFQSHHHRWEARAQLGARRDHERGGPARTMVDPVCDSCEWTEQRVTRQWEWGKGGVCAEMERGTGCSRLIRTSSQYSRALFPKSYCNSNIEIGTHFYSMYV